MFDKANKDYYYYIYADLMIAHKHEFMFNKYNRSCMFHSIDNVNTLIT